MKKKYFYWIIAILLILVLIAVKVYYPIYQHDKKYKNAEYCYNYTFMKISYQNVPNKECICDGETISSCQDSGFFIKLCDIGEVRCFGEVKGTKYFFYFETKINEDATHIEEKSFNSINEFEVFCNTLKDEQKTDCFKKLNETKSAEIDS
jgi:hypothetical protein